MHHPLGVIPGKEISWVHHSLCIPAAHLWAWPCPTQMPHPALELQDRSCRHLHARLPKPSFWMQGPGEAACVSLGSSYQHSFFITQIEGPVYYILNSLSSRITLMWYHFSLLECHNKERCESMTAPVRVLQTAIWNIGLNQFQVTLVAATHPCRLSSFICTM